MIPIVYHPLYRVGIMRGGITRQTKYAYLADRLMADGGKAPYRFFEPSSASFQTLTTIHDARYVSSVRDLTLSEAALRRIGFSRVPEIYTRPALSSGGTLLAARAALDFGVAFNLAGGSHHAHRDFGSGYCVFNDVAVAARVLLNEARVKRVAILDLDVHQGDGTAALFCDDPRVITLSVHGEKNFPARKVKGDFDLGLPKGAQDQAYTAAIEKAILYLDKQPTPDILFYNGGVDIMVTDRLGQLCVTPAGLKLREEVVFGFAKKKRIPIVHVLGGGYDENKERLTDHHMVAVRKASQLYKS